MACKECQERHKATAATQISNAKAKAQKEAEPALVAIVDLGACKGYGWQYAADAAGQVVVAWVRVVR